MLNVYRLIIGTLLILTAYEYDINPLLMSLCIGLFYGFHDLGKESKSE